MSRNLRPLSVRLVTAVVGALLAMPVGGLEGQPPAEIWREVELAPGILGFVTVDEVNASSYANAIVFHGSDATLVVDTQDRPSAAARIVEAIRRRGLPPVRWVVNTHYHSDHTIGNATFARAWPEAVFVAHPATRDSLDVGGARAIEEQRGRILDLIGRIEDAVESGEVPEEEVARYEAALVDRRVLAEELAAARARVPDETVAQSRVMALGGRELILIHPGVAHTRGDLVVWDPERDFLAAGDLLEEAPLWLEGADVAGWTGALARLRKLDPETVLPSHGRVREGAGLLDAHWQVLDRAVRVADMQGFGSQAAIVAEFSDLETLLEPYGVGVDAFRAYVVEAVRRLQGEEPGG